jgi:hypothetical protein
MREHAQGRYEFTYLTAHGSPAELIDRAFAIADGWMDRHITAVAEAAGDSRVLSVLGRLSFKDKLDLMLPEGVNALDNEYGARYMWQELYDLIELRPQMDAADAEATLRAWLEKRGWYDPEIAIPRAPEPLHSEIVLRISLDGLLVFLDGWFDGTTELGIS